MTPLFRDPFLWLRRFRHRCGYGVHSPFAFGFITEVVYEHQPYYAFSVLDEALSWKQRFRVRRYLHLLFRLSNYAHPSDIFSYKADKFELAYVKAACLHARCHELERNSSEDGIIDPLLGARPLAGSSGSESDTSSQRRLVFLGSPCQDALKLIDKGTMLVLANVHEYKEWWDGLPSVVSFDLYDVGIAFFDPHYNEHHYIVNF